MLKSRKEGKEGTKSYIHPSSHNSLQIFFLNFYLKCCVLLLPFLLFLFIANLSFHDLEMSLEGPQWGENACFLWASNTFSFSSCRNCIPISDLAQVTLCLLKRVGLSLAKSMATCPASYTAVHTSVKSRQEGGHSLRCQVPVASWSLGGWLCQP